MIEDYRFYINIQVSIINQVSMQLQIMDIVIILQKLRELKRTKLNGIGKVKERLLALYATSNTHKGS